MKSTITTKTEIVMLPIDQLYAHPDNPRKNLGDLTELSDSIRIKGVLQNLTVVPGHYLTEDERKKLQLQYDENPTEELRQRLNTTAGGDTKHMVPEGYTILIGHRRCAAARQAGLTALPCIIADSRNIDTDALKAIRVDGAEDILAAVGYGPDTLQEMERYIHRYGNKKTDRIQYRVALYRKAIPIMRTIKGIERLKKW